MNIESTKKTTITDTAITYSECYAQVFSRLFLGDCLIESDKIESGSVDLILTDLPYGTMKGQSKTGIYHNGQEKHEWDSIIDTDKIMQVANRILRKNGKMILFAQEPYTRELINKAIPNLPFNYRAIWLKDTLGSFMRSKSALLYRTEDILIFSKMNDIARHAIQSTGYSPTFYTEWRTDMSAFLSFIILYTAVFFTGFFVGASTCHSHSS